MSNKKKAAYKKKLVNAQPKKGGLEVLGDKTYYINDLTSTQGKVSQEDPPGRYVPLKVF